MFDLLFEEEVGEGIYFCNVVGECGERVVMEIVVKCDDWVGDFDFFVDVFVVVLVCVVVVEKL